MNKYANPKLTPKVTPFAVGALYADRQVFNLADPAYKPSALGIGDLIQIGIVPAGCTLVPQLSTASIAILDTNGSATAKFTIGTEASAASLLAEKSGNAVVAVAPGGFLSPTIGSPDTNTPIYAKVTVAAATVAATGTITADWVFRAYQSEIDS